MVHWKLVRIPTWEFEEEHELVAGEVYSIGRAKLNRIICPSEIVSREHCILCVEDNTIKVKDLKSSNGTFIDENRITPQDFHTVKDKQKIALGASENIKGGYIYQLVKDTDYSNGSNHNNNTTVELAHSFKIKSCKEESSDQEDSIQDKLYSLHTDKPTSSEKDAVKVEIENNSEEDIFQLKREIEFECDDDCIQIDSDSESEAWLSRLSQGSPGKPLQDARKCLSKSEEASNDSSDIVCLDSDTEDEEEDILFIPSLEDGKALPEVAERDSRNSYEFRTSDIISTEIEIEDEIIDKAIDNVESIGAAKLSSPNTSNKASSSDDDIFNTSSRIQERSEVRRSIALIDASPLTKPGRSKRATAKKLLAHCLPSSKEQIKQHKEERKAKLKALAEKRKHSDAEINDSKQENVKKQKVVAKVSHKSRGDCLATEVTDKPVSRHQVEQKILKTNKSGSADVLNKTRSKLSEEQMLKNVPEDVVKKRISHELSLRVQDSVPTVLKTIPVSNVQVMSDVTINKKIESSPTKLARVSDRTISAEGSFSCKSKKKCVTFSENLTVVKEFEVEAGNKMRPTKEAILKDVKPGAVLSLVKRFLMHVLRWSPRWLVEQRQISQPPPILPHHNPPTDLCQWFKSHQHYVHVITDLLLMEIWENVTQSYNKRYMDPSTKLNLSVESIPPVYNNDSFGPANLWVNLSLMKSQRDQLPRVGDLMIIDYKTPDSSSSTFFYVNNVRELQSPPNNVNSFFSINLNTLTYEKMNQIRPGDKMVGTCLYCIKNEVVLVEAMDELRCSPLCQVILKPEPSHFPKIDFDVKSVKRCKWTEHLNDNQLLAVACSVKAALTDEPSINMVQGPPGTGKSSVICATVMKCLFDENGARRYLRNKILVCATSNAAVDELLVRLLNIRQNLPKQDRFRMVRVGREESMHPEARHISLQTLTRREIMRQNADTPSIDLEMVAWFEAKVNSWQAATDSALDPARRACCERKLNTFKKKLALIRGGQSFADGGETLAKAERLIIEGADIIMTTLSSSGSQKLKCLKHRVALCIVDEAGQAIEPETLVPLTLQVTKLMLVGDPQQLPGFLCSQRAKQHGLSESLFSRLAGYTEDWPLNPVILLNTQYRMHPEIADYPNRAFYAGKLRNGTLKMQNDLPFTHYRLLFVSSGDKGQDEEGANRLEAWAATRVFLSMGRLAPHLSKALLTPYAGHRQCLLKCLTQAGQDDCLNDVFTLDSFQGQERDLIVVSLARSCGLGFLTYAGRLNVLLTRAKKSLVLCLNPDSANKNRIWRTLLEDALRRNTALQLPQTFTQPMLSNHLDLKQALIYLK